MLLSAKPLSKRHQVWGNNMTYPKPPSRTRLSKSLFARQNWFFWVITLLLLLIVGYTIHFFLTHKKVSASPQYQLTATARKNPFFAMQQFLENDEKTVQVSDGESAHQRLKRVWQQSESQAKHSAVLLVNVTQDQTPDMPEMLAWVERGGHLITFAHDTLVQPSEQTDKDAQKEAQKDEQQRYYNNENALLTYLGIENREKAESPEQILATIKAKMAETKTTDNDKETKTNTVNLARKVVLHLPAQGHEQAVDVLLASYNEGKLNVDKFKQKFAQAKPVADYNALTAQHIGNLPLKVDELAKLRQAVAKNPTEFANAEQAMWDVKLGKGRITVFNDDRLFNNPNSYFLLSESPNKVEEQKENAKNSFANPSPIVAGTFWQQLTKDAIKPNIAELDNAYILRYLLADRDTVWVVPDVSVASLPVLLWRQAKWACLAVLVCLLMGMLALPKRFGRAQRFETDTQYNIFGYFDQVGAYLWQTDQAQALVAQNRTRLLDKIFALYPNLNASIGQPSNQSSRQAELCQTLAQDLGITPSAVALALFEDWHDDSTFLRVSREFALLQRRLNDRKR